MQSIAIKATSTSGGHAVSICRRITSKCSTNKPSPLRWATLIVRALRYLSNPICRLYRTVVDNPAAREPINTPKADATSGPRADGRLFQRMAASPSSPTTAIAFAASGT
jgi:hypothetical protein